MNYIKFAVPFFILLIAVEFIYGWLRKRNTYRVNDTIGSLQMGVVSQTKGVLRLGISGLVFGYLVELLGVRQLPADSVLLWVVTFVVYDCLYYWKHRYGHQWRIMWASHSAHHQSEEYNLSTALRQTGTDYIGFIFYLPLYLAGVPVEVIISVGSLNLIYQFWVHTEHVRRIGFLEWILVTPSNHRVHHARNPEYIDKNYGGFFIIWDRLFGTFKDEQIEQPCVYGVTNQLGSFNPLWANFHVWYDTFAISLKTKKWSDKVKVWFKGPGWYPEDSIPSKSAEWQYPSFDPVISTFHKGYSFVQFWIITLITLWLPSTQETVSRDFMLIVFFWCIFSLYVQGTFLEGRSFAKKLEGVRLGSLIVGIMLAPGFWPSVTTALTNNSLIYAITSLALFLTYELYAGRKSVVPAQG